MNEAIRIELVNIDRKYKELWEKDIEDYGVNKNAKNK